VSTIVPDGLSPNESWVNGYAIFLLATRRFTDSVVQPARAKSQQSPIPDYTMKRFASAFLLLTAVLGGVSPLAAQQNRTSPHETISRVIDGNRITIVYGRPYSKNPKGDDIRKIWGGLVPYGQIWRTGADEATLLITQQPIMLGDTTVPAGAYSLWTLPAEDGTGKLIVNKQIGQWGRKMGSQSIYDESLDVVRVDLKKDPL
jgi:hypothetical protein